MKGPGRKIVCSGEEIVELLRGLAYEQGERITIKKFVRLSGVPESHIYLYFDSWGDVREQAGLNRHLKQAPWYSQDDLLEEFHKVVQRLGRFPNCQEFTRHAVPTVQQLYRRFGSMGATVAGYRKWLCERDKDEREIAEEEIKNVQQPHEQAGRDVKWMRDRWLKMRVAFELQSSDFEGRPATSCDLLVVLKDDWPACPVPRFLLSKYLGNNQ